MNPVSHSQQLCPLRPFGPSFLSENPPTRNRSHSPQPPLRKRLYSEDFNSFLLDADARADRERSRIVIPDETRQISTDKLVPELVEESFINCQKSRPFFELHEQIEENEQIGEESVFGGMVQLREESEPEGIMPFLSRAAGKDEKHKHHFQEIFDSQPNIVFSFFESPRSSFT